MPSSTVPTRGAADAELQQQQQQKDTKCWSDSQRQAASPGGRGQVTFGVGSEDPKRCRTSEKHG